MIKAGDAKLQVTQEIILGFFRAFLGDNFPALETLHLEHRAQARFNDARFPLEMLQQLQRARFFINGAGFIIEHHLDKLGLRQHRREVSDGDHKESLIHGAKAIEVSAAFLINRQRHHIRKMRKCRIAIVGSVAPDGIHMHHPTASQTGERLIDAVRNDFTLLIGTAGIVITLIKPRRHQRAVLADNDAVIHHCGVIEQVGKPCILGTEMGELLILINHPQPSGQYQQEQHSRNRHEDGKGHYHL